jgi:predicted flap endonuclease-1-like 5' DNA nuclease
MATEIQEIEGIGASSAAKLKEIGIDTVEKLLQEGFYPKGRKAIADQTGISGKKLLDWIGMADLFRVRGVGKQFAELLKAAGVDTVKELKMRNPNNLATALSETNEEKNICKAVPHLVQLENWIAQAKHLESRLTY